MNPIRNVLSALSRALEGPRHLLLGYRLLLRPGVRRFMLVPLLGNLLLFAAAFALAAWGLDALLDRWLPQVLDWLRWLLYPLLAILVLVAGFFSFTVLGNLLLAPFNGLLSQSVERALGAEPGSAPDETLWQSMKRSSRLALWRFGFILLRVAAVFLLGLVPAVGVLALPVGVLLGAWLLALEFSDSPLGNWGASLEQQRALVRENRSGFIAFGLAAMAMSLVPVLNFALIPAAVAGMTAYCLPRRRAVLQRAEQDLPR